MKNIEAALPSIKAKLDHFHGRISKIWMKHVYSTVTNCYSELFFKIIF